MSIGFSIIQGLKATCGQCEKEFPMGRGQQLKLFALEPFPCPSCDAMQVLPQEPLDALKAKGNPGRVYMMPLGIMGFCGLAFFGSVLLGLINNEGLIMLGFVLAVGGQIAVSMGFRSATSDLRVQLSPPNTEQAPGQAIRQDQ